MERRELKTLILNDDDLECDYKKKITLTELNLNHISLKLEDIKDFDLIVYKGIKGTKILRSSYFRVGKIE